ncbi:macro domain-containing protein [Kutzneria sp. 744]|uniref:macro domain-containing protein n=1 Tax=Kutzneria sp. (strain 744) TaxID=345341 RepID=UPI0004B1ECB4|nr:macro domain-containing protein [Kutzneria sp. 744]
MVIERGPVIGGQGVSAAGRRTTENANPHPGKPAGDLRVSLPLGAYREAILLDRPFQPTAPPASPELLDGIAEAAVRALGYGASTWRNTGLTPRQVLRAALTVRRPEPLEPHVTSLLDTLLGGERALRMATDALAVPTVAEIWPATRYPAADLTALWRGDITMLRADAVANAANRALLGCFRPMHNCVDNAVHAAAGPWLREDCHTIATAQGAPETTGAAKITRGYHLPARYVVHTVGPIVDGLLEPWHEQALARSYRACLELAAEVEDIRTVAFCGISTGVFGFPKARAARIALDAVAGWLGTRPNRFDRVVFTTFASDDDAAYQEHLATWTI